MQEFMGLAFTKFTIFTVVSKTFFRPIGIALAARTSLWMLQCKQVASGAAACTRVNTPLCLPVVAFVPSVRIYKGVKHFENVHLCCPCLQRFTKEHVLPNCLFMNVSHIHKEMCQARHISCLMQL
ncbi:hypothetical protein GOODEAATRI_025677 [Goodea atripinnis]|uniref:Secreted protein n=1 Tax=Goodea atripinnis TaxID=208336 RepID=A0ABV0Q1R8_9TELE